MLDFRNYFQAGDPDYTGALQRAIDANAGTIYIPDGIYDIRNVNGGNVHIAGTGTLRKAAESAFVMLNLTGDNLIDGVTIDYAWPDVALVPEYDSYIAIQQVKGALELRGVTFRRSLYAAVYCNGGSFRSDSACRFVEGAPHGQKSGGPTHYLLCRADADTETQNKFIAVAGGLFVGTSLATADLHRNPTGILIDARVRDGERYESVSVVGATLLGCTTNVAGNITGAIDTYNGARNVVISDNVIRFFTYAGIKVQNSSNLTVTGNVLSEGAVPPGSTVPHANGIDVVEGARYATALQKTVVISSNVIEGCAYTGIFNSCDNAVIGENVIDGVAGGPTTATGIDSVADHVVITGNRARVGLGGRLISAVGSDVLVRGNDVGSDAAGIEHGIFVQGDRVRVSGNLVRCAIASSGGGVRVQAPSSFVQIDDNLIDGFNYGVDIRGASSSIDLGINQFANIATARVSIEPTVTGISRAQRMLPVVSTTAAVPPLAVGAGSPVAVLACPGARFGDEVAGTGVRDMLGLIVVAWVSADDVISWYVLNPQGSPLGAQSLPTTLFRFLVTSLEQD